MSTTKQASKNKVSRELLAAMHVIALADGKTKYKESDIALEALVEQATQHCKACGQIVAGQIIELGTDRPIPVELRGKKFRVIDKFALRNSVGVGMSARRFELELVKEP